MSSSGQSYYYCIGSRDCIILADLLIIFHKQLPHHEHLLPDVPSESLKDRLYKEIEEADGQPKTVQAEVKLEQAKRDETNIRMAVHASLPACLDQVNLFLLLTGKLC